MSYMIYALLRLYKRATRTCGGGSYISEEISKMVGAFSENKAFGIRVNKLGGDICRRIWETMHLINNFLKCCQRFKEFYDGGWLLLESLLVESQMGVRVTVFYCPENHSLLRFKELGIAHIVILPKFRGQSSHGSSKTLKPILRCDETKSRPRTKNPYLLKADTRSGVEIENRDEYLPLSIMLSILELAKAMPFLSKTHPKQAETVNEHIHIETACWILLHTWHGRHDHMNNIVTCFKFSTARSTDAMGSFFVFQVFHPSRLPELLPVAQWILGLGS
ncbi:hypothetical protein DY000_02004615 [Brassica cretica]|uniref:Uncharacterized protein n=1 Tax=Brassica cretica TaxID=69181 RepID=A0ABQ7CMZ4_BRACR|nr:hypothetical protein DY000_02004615 [Brassica cretica]